MTKAPKNIRSDIISTCVKFLSTLQEANPGGEVQSTYSYYHLPPVADVVCTCVYTVWLIYVTFKTAAEDIPNLLCESSAMTEIQF
jgi:hypothetical protein